MHERDVRLLTRAKWVGVLLPIAFIWGFEVVRWWVVEPSVPDGLGPRLRGARHERRRGPLRPRPLRHPRPRPAPPRRVEPGPRRHPRRRVGAPGRRRARGDARRSPSTASSQHTGALAGEIRVAGPGGRPLVVRRPPGLGAGLQWVEAILDDDAGRVVRRMVLRTDLPGVDATVDRRAAPQHGRAGRRDAVPGPPAGRSADLDGRAGRPRREDRDGRRPGRRRSPTCAARSTSARRSTASPSS